MGKDNSYLSKKPTRQRAYPIDVEKGYPPHSNETWGMMYYEGLPGGGVTMMIRAVYVQWDDPEQKLRSCNPDTFGEAIDPIPDNAKVFPLPVFDVAQDT